MKTTYITVRTLAAASLLLAAGTAQAVWPFNESSTAKAEKIVSEGNTQLQAADEVWRAGNMPKAVELYQAAAETYRQAEKLSPNLQNGLIKFRISYCASQVEQVQSVAREKARPEARVAFSRATLWTCSTCEAQ